MVKVVGMWGGEIMMRKEKITIATPKAGLA